MQTETSAPTSTAVPLRRSVLRAGFDFELTRQISCFLDGHYPVQQTSEEVTGLAIPENMEGTQLVRKSLRLCTWRL